MRVTTAWGRRRSGQTGRFFFFLFNLWGEVAESDDATPAIGLCVQVVSQLHWLCIALHERACEMATATACVCSDCVQRAGAQAVCSLAVKIKKKVVVLVCSGAAVWLAVKKPSAYDKKR